MRGRATGKTTGTYLYITYIKNNIENERLKGGW